MKKGKITLKTTMKEVKKALKEAELEEIKELNENLKKTNDKVN